MAREDETLTTSTVATLHDAYKRYEVVKDDDSLREAFHEAGNGLPLIIEILIKVRDFGYKHQLSDGYAEMLASCNTAAERTANIIREVAQTPTTSRFEMYEIATKSRDNGKAVDVLVQQIMSDISTWIEESSMRQSFEDDVKRLHETIAKISKMAPSTREEDLGHSFHHIGYGYQNNVPGGTINRSSGEGNHFPGANFSGSLSFGAGPTWNSQRTADTAYKPNSKLEDDCIEFLVDEVRKDLSSLERTLMKPHFPSCLEEFAVRLGNEDGSILFLDMMHVFYAKRKNITEQMCQDVAPTQMHKSQSDQGHERLRKSKAYSWFISTARRKLQMNGLDAKIMEYQRSWILHILRENTPSEYGEISRQRKPNQYTIRFKLDWNMLMFMQHQEYSDDDNTRGIISKVITLTGYQGKVYATSLGDYMTTVWPSTGPDLVEFFEDFWANSQQPLEGLLRSSTEICARVEGNHTLLEATGTEYDLAEIVEQLFWFSSALQSKGCSDLAAPSNATVVAQVKKERFLANHALTPLGSEGIFIGCVECEVVYTMSTSSGPDLSVNDGNCWYPLFEYCRIVEGYPIPARPDDQKGLEISLEMMAALASAEYVTAFCDTLIIKGVSTLLFATSADQDVIVWHLIHNEDRSPISFSDDRIRLSSEQGENMVLLQPTAAFHSRHFIGWAEEVTSHVGSNTADYIIKWSGLCSPREDYHVEKAQLSVSKIGGGTLSFCRGNREKPLHNPVKSDIYARNLEKIKNNYVILYDVDSQRAWLIHAIQALLHLTQTYLRSTRKESGDLVLSIKGKVPPENIDAETALNLLLDQRNMEMDVRRSTRPSQSNDLSTTAEDEPYRLRDVVKDRLEKLEQMIAYVSDRRSETSLGFRIRTSFAEKLIGYDFMQVAGENTHASPLVTELRHEGRGWRDFIGWIDAPVLFGKDFGELLKPTQNSNSGTCTDCYWNCDVPKDRELLCVPMSVLEQLVQQRGQKMGTSWRLIEDFHIDIPGLIFSECQVDPKHGSHISRVREFTKKPPGSSIFRSISATSFRRVSNATPSPRGGERSGREQTEDALNRPLAAILIGKDKLFRSRRPKTLAATQSIHRAVQGQQQPSRSPSSSSKVQTGTSGSSVPSIHINDSTDPFESPDISDSETTNTVSDHSGKGKESGVIRDGEPVTSTRAEIMDDLDSSLAARQQELGESESVADGSEGANGAGPSSTPTSLPNSPSKSSVLKSATHKEEENGIKGVRIVNNGLDLPEVNEKPAGVVKQAADVETSQRFGQRRREAPPSRGSNRRSRRRLVSRDKMAMDEETRASSRPVPRTSQHASQSQAYLDHGDWMIVTVSFYMSSEAIFFRGVGKDVEFNSAYIDPYLLMMVVVHAVSDEHDIQGHESARPVFRMASLTQEYHRNPVAQINGSNRISISKLDRALFIIHYPD